MRLFTTSDHFFYLICNFSLWIVYFFQSMSICVSSLIHQPLICLSLFHIPYIKFPFTSNILFQLFGKTQWKWMFYPWFLHLHLNSMALWVSVIQQAAWFPSPSLTVTSNGLSTCWPHFSGQGLSQDCQWWEGLILGRRKNSSLCYNRKHGARMDEAVTVCVHWQSKNEIYRRITIP